MRINLQVKLKRIKILIEKKKQKKNKHNLLRKTTYKKNIKKRLNFSTKSENWRVFKKNPQKTRWSLNFQV